MHMFLLRLQVLIICITFNQIGSETLLRVNHLQRITIILVELIIAGELVNKVFILLASSPFLLCFLVNCLKINSIRKGCLIVLFGNPLLGDLINNVNLWHVS